MATFTAVLALLAFLAAGSTLAQNSNSQDADLSLSPLWIMDKKFAADHGKAKLSDLIIKLRAVLQGLETEAKPGQRVGLGLSDHFASVKLDSSRPPTNYDGFEDMASIVESHLQDGTAGWTSAGAYFVVSGEATGEGYHVLPGKVCDSDMKKYRLVMFRYIKDDDTTVKTMARAIGHFLGIRDDYSTGFRYKRMHKCFNVGGYMDNGLGNHWTSCSKYDFKNRYNAGNLACLRI